ncbi:MAG: hypothetical protein HC919_02205 [Oscillatoriales cyanobacterium SM2_2_1]|nr:hypothetical protein [Oscillatoriales cyanobacterium SM2_2_1]
MYESVLTDHIDSLPVGERWSVCTRLAELSIYCECVQGKGRCLDVEIKNSSEAILVCMTLFRFTTTRSQHLSWLERCWQMSVTPNP